jgi:MFS family permease
MRQRLASAAWSLRRVAANRDIRRAEAAWMLGWTGEWSWLVALFVYAYAVGDVALVGATGLVRTMPAAFLAPALSVLADRWPRHHVLLAVHSGRAVLIGAAALVALADWPPAIVIAIASLDGLLAVLHRPSHLAMTPSLARSPEELVAANVASSTLEAVGILVGPIIGGVLVGTGQTALSFGIPALTFVLAAGAVAGIRPVTVFVRSTATAGPRDLLLGGAHALRDHPHAALILGLLGIQTLVRGLLSVLLVVVAIELLAIGEEGVGFLNAAIGAGGFIGAISAVALVGRSRLTPPLLFGLLMWGLPIVAIGLAPAAAVAFAALALLGAGNAVLDIAAFTLLQRVVPNSVRGRIFGMLEAVVMLTVGIGSALAPALVALAGNRGALIITGVLMPTAAIAAWRWLRRADDRAVIPRRQVALLRGVPMFSQLPMTTLEEVACRMTPRTVAVGMQIVTEGEVGETFYVLSSGSVEVSQHGAPLHRLEPGESFGEIALLRNVPRTASVRAVDEVEVMVLERDAFLAVVAGDRLSRAAADEVVQRRLALDADT